MQAGPYRLPFKVQGLNTTFFCDLHQELLPTALMQNSNTSCYAFPLQAEATDHKVPLTCCQHNQLEQAIQHSYSSSKVRLRESEALS